MRNVALLTLSTLVACTASKANIQIVSAEETLKHARELHADRSSVYEYTMAARYLEKAREESGYAEYRVADALARQSAEWADRAIIATEKRGRTNMDMDTLHDGGPAPTGPAPVPAPPSVPSGLEDILGPTAPVAPGEPVTPAEPAPPEPAPAPIDDPEEDVEIPK